MNDAQIRDLLRRAAERRATGFSGAGSTLDAYRVVNGPGDGAPAGLVIERYASWVVLSAREAIDATERERWARAALDVLGADGLVIKVLRRPASKSSSEVFAGTLPSAPIAVREDDATFLCDLDSGPSTGLFLDQRDARRRARTFSLDVEVLNLFAYTCSFSVHCALAGARRVTSVDLAKKALRRGRENMTASGLDPDRHRWFPDDVLEHLRRASRREQRYGLVILDPPTFGRAGTSVLALERDLEVLVGLAASVVAPGGVLFVSVNAGTIDLERMERAATAEPARAGRRVDVIDRLGLPAIDHPVAQGVALDVDRGEYLKTLVLRVG